MAAGDYFQKPDDDPDIIAIRYLKPIADRALHEWFGQRYAELHVYLRNKLAEDVADIMLYEELRPSQYPSNGAIVACMLLDERIYPATLAAYAECL